MGTQTVGGRMKLLLVKEQLRPSEALSCGKGHAHSSASGAHVPSGGDRPTEKNAGTSEYLVFMCAQRTRLVLETDWDQVG